MNFFTYVDSHWGWLALFFFALLAFIHNIWALVNSIWTIKWIIASWEQEWAINPEIDTKIVVLLPMLSEKKIVTATLNYWMTIYYPPDLIKIIPITKREDFERGTTTASLINKWISENTDQAQRVIHLHLPDGGFCKADQLNFALDQINVNLSGWITDMTFFAVYDADSRPDRRVLLELNHTSKKYKDVQAFQQGSLYFADYDNLPSGILGWYLKSRPFYNMRFCFYRELPAFFRSINKMRSKNWLLRTVTASPNHFLGHGEFIQKKLMDQFGQFPHPSADTSMGTMLSFYGYAIAPLATFDCGQTPASIRDLFFQGITWYSGCSLYWRDLRVSLQNGLAFSFEHLLMCSKRFIENMIWCIGPILLALVLIFAFLDDAYTIVLLSLLAVFILSLTVKT